MVSFSCEACGDVLTKKKLDPHRGRCQGASFTCIDCMVHFAGTEYRTHTSCMTEAQKYQGSLYQNKKAKTSATTSVPTNPKTMARAAYVEEVVDDHSWRDYEVNSDDDNRSITSPPPEAPTPPSAAEGPLDPFKYFVGQATPTASTMNLLHDGTVQFSEDTQLVRFDPEASATLGNAEDDEMIQYGTGPVSTTKFQTPAPKSERRKVKDATDSEKKDKKRKRLHIETDHVMTDAPPVLHTGLTGGINRMMASTTTFPPSPDYSGGDAPETPGSPLKKSRHSKKSGRPEIGNSIMAMIAASASSKTKPKAKPKKKSATTTTTTKKTRHRIEAPKEPKLLEYRPGSKDKEKEKENEKAAKGAEDGQMVVFKPRAEHFLSFVTKGPESERGCSVNKALKRWHRARSASASSSSSTAKLVDEKELWKTLRLRKNDRGEIVLFVG